MKIHANLTLANMNTRVEMAGDKPGQGACTLKFTGIVSEQQMIGLFTNPKEAKRLCKTLWNEDGEVLATEIKAIPMTTEIIGGKAFLKPEMDDGMMFDNVKVSDLEIVPVHGRVCEVTLKLAVYPDKDSLWFLFSKQRCALSVSAYPAQMSLELEDRGDIPAVQLASEEEEEGDAARQQNLLGDDFPDDLPSDHIPPLGDVEGSGIGME